MANRKFAIGAWFFTILLVAVLSGIIGFFYYQNFPLDTSLPYFGAVIFLATVSIWLTKYHDEPGEAFTKASFISKCFLIVLMAINAAFCFHLGRQMSVGRKMDDASKVQEREFNDRVESLKDAGPRAKLELAKAVREHQPPEARAESDAFKANEGAAFAIMLVEFVSGASVIMVMMGLMIFAMAKKQVEPDVQEREFVAVPTPDGLTEYRRFMSAQAQWDRPPRQSPALPVTASEIRAATEKDRRESSLKEDMDEIQKLREKPVRGHFSGLDRSKSQEKTGLDRSRPEAEIQQLRDTLKQISFYNPGISFKADARGGKGIAIRRYSSQSQGQYLDRSALMGWSKFEQFLAASPDERFRRLLASLNRHGFDLLGGAK